MAQTDSTDRDYTAVHPQQRPGMEREAAHMVSRGRTELILGHPFFGTLALRLKTALDWSIQTFSVDGVTLRYNPAYAVTLSQRQVTAVIAHEVMHCAMAHIARRGDRDHEKWNVAGDYAVNHVLDDAGFDLPEGALLEAAYAGLSADAIYSRLPDPSSSGGAGGSGQGSGQSPTGDFQDAPGTTGNAAAAHAVQQEWQVAASQAAQAARAAGKLPGTLEDLIQDLNAPKQDWRDLLRRFITSAAQEDFSWLRPNKRFIASGLYLPSRYSERVGAVGVVVDTSASVSADELKAFASEIQSICEDVRPEIVRVVYCDARVHKVDDVDVTAGDELRFEAKGRGGTDMRPAFDALTNPDDREPPCAVVCMSDLEFGGRWPDEPDMPVMWVSVEPGGQAPFGDVIHLDA